MTIYTPSSKTNTEPASDSRAGQTGRSTSRTSRRTEFRQILENQQATGKNVQGKENTSLRPERSFAIAQAKTARTADSGFAVSPSRSSGAGTLSAAVTSTLLRLKALTGSRNGSMLPLSPDGLQPGRTLAPLDRTGSLRNASFSPGSGRTSDGLGSLAARFESGEAGVDAIGYDRQGGTSYGQYQISSRAGTMSEFLEFLDERAPEWARDLRAAGPANTGGRSGAMPREWRRIASEDPQRFADLQRDFIERTHYSPALEEIREKTGVDMKAQPRALREVLWSTAVQHGARGAAKLFSRAIEQGGAPGGAGLSARKLIEDLYTERADQFGSSSADVRSAVEKRFQAERKLALGMLDHETRRRRATV